MSQYNKKDKYDFYEVSIDFIDFLRGEGIYKNRPQDKIDLQVKAHNKHINLRTNKYIGIIIEFQSNKYFAPLTHDRDNVTGERNWMNREECCDFEYVYNGRNQYVGSLLLCKALPLTGSMLKYLRISEIEKNEGKKYADLCADELHYLNSIEIHDTVQNKMRDCIYGKWSPYMNFRVDYHLVAKNVEEYNKMLNDKKKEEIVKDN